MHESLQDNGICCYIGIPYFRNIAKLYIERGPGTRGPVFDLSNVYRYTHGDPEQVETSWLEQLNSNLIYVNLFTAAHGVVLHRQI